MTNKLRHSLLQNLSPNRLPNPMQSLLASLLAMLLNLVMSAPVLAGEVLPREERVPGGIAILDVGSTEWPMPAVSFNDKPVLVISQSDRWLAVLGLPLAAKLGNHSLMVNGQALTFTVADKTYATQPLKVEPKFVNPDPRDAERIAREQALMQAAFARFSQPLPQLLTMLQPTPGPLSSSFGLRRVFNGEARSPHSGLDIAAVTGTPVIAPLAGTVVVTGDFYYNGNTVIVDHGGGLLSLFCHLERIDVKPEQVVQTGTRLGSVGATGRVTGAHLHFSVSLTGARVNPALFLPVPASP